MKKIIATVVAAICLLTACSQQPTQPIQSDDNNGHDVFWSYIAVDRGTQPDDFTVSDNEGNTFTLSEHRGEKVVIFYLKAGCGKCHDLLYTYQNVADELSDEYTCVFVEGTDNAADSTADAEDYVEENGFTFHLFYDTNKSLTKSIPINAYPVAICFDEDGIVRSFNLAQNRRDYDSVIEDIRQTEKAETENN